VGRETRAFAKQSGAQPATAGRRAARLQLAGCLSQQPAPLLKLLNAATAARSSVGPAVLQTVFDPKAHFIGESI
jgi:hypothetical protein